MIHTPADVMQQLMVNLGQANVVDDMGEWPVFVNYRPDDPSQLLVVSDTGGVLKNRSMRTGKTYDTPGLQVLLRTGPTAEPIAYNKALRLFAWCDLVLNEVVIIESTRYLVKHIQKTSTILQLGKEERTGRPMMSFNLLLEHEVAT